MAADALEKNDRLAPPLMYAFRTAHEKRDAKAKLDLRDEAGERVIAARRLTIRGSRFPNRVCGAK